MRANALPILILACSAVLAGCGTTPAADSAEPSPADYSFPADQYPAVHAAAVEVLRDYGFRIARDDYRFGTVTTYPKESPTTVEFWIDDPTTPAQHRADTLNSHQRTVRVMIDRVDFDVREALQGRSPETVEQPITSVYQLTAEVIVERLQLPDRYLTHSARGQLTATYTTTPTHLSDRGIAGPYAQALTRDPHLEARIVRAIAQRVTEQAESAPLQPAE